ncbi:hypothetical protein HDG32_005327 [Paraburkholderia sp. CI2]|nr:hypothetical protein [Paraburkholderia sp. CI2]
MFRSRKVRPENVFAAAAEIDTDFGERDAPAEKDGFSRLLEFFTKNLGASARQEMPPATPAAQAALPGNGGATGQQTSAPDAAGAQMFMAALAMQAEQQNSSLRTEVAGLNQKFSDLMTRLENTQFSQSRPLSTGGNGGDLTDC